MKIKEQPTRPSSTVCLSSSPDKILSRLVLALHKNTMILGG